jgi:hypothetical protein
MEMEARRYDNKGESKCVIGEEITVDWRGKPSNPNKHGGMRAAAFVLGMSYSLSLSPSKPNTCVCVCVCVWFSDLGVSWIFLTLCNKWIPFSWDVKQ